MIGSFSLRSLNAVSSVLRRVINSNPLLEESAKALPSALNSFPRSLYGGALRLCLIRVCVRFACAREKCRFYA